MLNPQGASKRFENDRRKAAQAGLLSQAAKNSVRMDTPADRVNPGQREAGLQGNVGQLNSGSSESIMPALQSIKQTQLPSLNMSELAAGFDASKPQVPAPAVDFEAIQREVAMEQLLSSPQVQESVARAKLKQYFRAKNGNGSPDDVLDLGAMVIKDLQKFM